MASSPLSSILRFRWATWGLLPGFMLPPEGRELFEMEYDQQECWCYWGGSSTWQLRFSKDRVIKYVKYDITIGGGWGQVRGAVSQYCCYHCVIRWSRAGESDSTCGGRKELIYKSSKYNSWAGDGSDALVEHSISWISTYYSLPVTTTIVLARLFVW